MSGCAHFEFYLLLLHLQSQSDSQLIHFCSLDLFNVRTLLHLPQKSLHLINLSVSSIIDILLPSPKAHHNSISNVSSISSVSDISLPAPKAHHLKHFNYLFDLVNPRNLCRHKDFHLQHLDYRSQTIQREFLGTGTTLSSVLIFDEDKITRRSVFRHDNESGEHDGPKPGSVSAFPTTPNSS